MSDATDSDGKLLVRGIVTVAGLILIAYLGWLGITVTSLGEEVSAMSAKLDIVLADRNAHIARNTGEKP